MSETRRPVARHEAASVTGAEPRRRGARGSTRCRAGGQPKSTAAAPTERGPWRTSSAPPRTKPLAAQAHRAGTHAHAHNSAMPSRALLRPGRRRCGSSNAARASDSALSAAGSWSRGSRPCRRMRSGPRRRRRRSSRRSATSTSKSSRSSRRRESLRARRRRTRSRPRRQRTRRRSRRWRKRSSTQSGRTRRPKTR